MASSRCTLIALLVALAATLSGTASAHAAMQHDRFLVVGCYVSNTDSPDIAGYADPGIREIIGDLHPYFDQVSNGKVDLQGDFAGWYELPRSTDQYKANHGLIAEDCKAKAREAMAAQPGPANTEGDYKAKIMLYNDDVDVPNQSLGDGWVQLRWSGGTGGGWTSEAVWAHELGHVYGLQHSTAPDRSDGNEYNNPWDVMSGFKLTRREYWHFAAGGICNGIRNLARNVTAYPLCLYSGSAWKNTPQHPATAQKQLAGWLDPDQVVTQTGGSHAYELSAPVYDPGRQRTDLPPVQLIEIPRPGTLSRYYIEYQRTEDGSTDDAAQALGWDWHQKGLPQGDAVLIYKYTGGQPDVNVLGNLNLEAVVHQGETLSVSWLPFSVRFAGVEQNRARMIAAVTVDGPDLTAPVTTLSGDGVDGRWVDHAVTATLSADGGPDGASPAQVLYSVDQPGCTSETRDCFEYTGPITIAGDGEHVLHYFSIDTGGNVEPTRSAAIRIDTRAPRTSLRTDPAAVAGSAWVNRDANLVFAGTDAGSGVRATYFGVDQPLCTPAATRSCDTWNGLLRITDGDHIVTYFSVDNSGRAEALKRVRVRIDRAAPTCAVQIKTAVALRPTGRNVAVRTTVTRADTGGSGVNHVALREVAVTGPGAAVNWATGTADVTGSVLAAPGASYRFSYLVSDAAGNAGTCDATVAVPAS
jgi:hypothetical protein